MSVELEVVADERAAARRGAELIAAAGRGAVAERGSFAGDERRHDSVGDARDLSARRGDALGRDRALPGRRADRLRRASEDRNLTHLVLGLSIEHQSALRPMPVTQRDLEAAAARLRILAARSARPRPPRPRPRRPHRLAGPGRPGPRGDRPPGGPDRRRVPGPPPDDADLPELAAARQSSGWSPARRSASRSPSCSPATTRSRPAGSRTKTWSSSPTRPPRPDVLANSLTSSHESFPSADRRGRDRQPAFVGGEFSRRSGAQPGRAARRSGLPDQSSTCT